MQTVHIHVIILEGKQLLCVGQGLVFNLTQLTSEGEKSCNYEQAHELVGIQWGGGKLRLGK